MEKGKHQKGKKTVKGKKQIKAKKPIKGIIVLIIIAIILIFLVTKIAKKGSTEKGWGCDNIYTAYDMKEGNVAASSINIANAMMQVANVGEKKYHSLEEYLKELKDIVETEEKGKWRIVIDDTNMTSGKGKDKEDVYMLEEDKDSYKVVYYKSKNKSKVITTIEKSK